MSKENLEWIDGRSNKKKVVVLEILEDGMEKAELEIDHLFDANDPASIAGAVVEITESLKKGYKLRRVNSTFGQERKRFIQRLVNKGVKSAC